VWRHPYWPSSGFVYINLLRGVHSFLFDQRYDLELRGTRLDPYSRLWNGPGLSLRGLWGPNDVIMYVTTNVVLTYGKPTSAAGNVIQLDPSAPVTPNALVNMYLNPNQGQKQTFLILANDATSITVDGDISSLVTTEQYYYVLSPRDRNRFTRITERLNREFANQDIDVRVLFI
jgi:hypothetical protein